jgi:hypothetical protein
MTITEQDMQTLSVDQAETVNSQLHLFSKLAPRKRDLIQECVSVAFRYPVEKLALAIKLLKLCRKLSSNEIEALIRAVLKHA